MDVYILACLIILTKKFYLDPFKFPDKCFGLRLEFIDEFTEIVRNTFGPLTGNQEKNLYSCKQFLMMANEMSESARNNFHKFIYQL